MNKTHITRINEIEGRLDGIAQRLGRLESICDRIQQDITNYNIISSQQDLRITNLCKALYNFGEN